MSAPKMKSTNMLFIMSDEHNKRVLGCYGHQMVKTPNLDRIAAKGTRFLNAYTNCPICVPARASFATGQYVHRIRYWDNAIGYDGRVPSWGHRLMEQGHHVASIGKLHYVDSDPQRNGFDEEILPMHMVPGGDLLGLMRDELTPRPNAAKLGPQAGPGEFEYTRFDRSIATEAVRWLENEAPKHRDKPWALYVGFISPHFPLIAPREFYDLYPEDQVPWPDMYDAGQRPRHPFTDSLQKCLPFDASFDAQMVRRAIAAYFGLVSFLDDNVGKILQALEQRGLMENTRVVYSTDHGDNLGTRGMWGKSTMYEESAGIPLLMAGPDIPKSSVCSTPVTLVDGFQTFIQALGAKPDPRDAPLPGHSLLEIAQGFVPERTILSEYHATGATTGAYMIRHGKYKYIHYVGLPPMLFDLDADPYERNDLGQDPQYAVVTRDCQASLRKVVDPEAMDKLARADQQIYIDKYGGKEAIRKRGMYQFSPPPGVDAVFQEAK